MSSGTVAAAVKVKIGAVLDSSVGSVFGKAGSGLRKIGDTMKDLAGRAQTMKQLDRESVRLGESVQALTTRYDAQAATLAKAEAHLQKLKDKTTAAGTADEKLAAQLANADAAVMRARTNLDRTNASLTKTKTDFTEASASAEKFRAANQHVESSLGKLGSAMKRYESASAALQANEAKRAEYRSKIVGVLAAGMFIKKSVETAAEGEQSALRFKWSLDGQYTQTQIGSLMAKTRAIAARSLATTPDLLKIQTVLHKENLGPDEALAAAEAVHRVAAVTKQDAEETAAAIGGIFHTVGLSMTGSTEQKLTRIGDIVATMQQRFKITDVGGLAEGLNKALPQATMARVSFEQVGAAIGEMTRNGSTSAADAGQGVSIVLRNLTKASQALGFQLQHDTNGNLDFNESLRAMNYRIETMGGREQNRDLITKIFGGKGGTNAAFFLMKAAEGADELADAQKEMANSAGSVAREYKDLEESTQGMILKIGKAWNQFLTPIGRALLPGIKAVLEPIGKLFERFGTFLEEHETTAKWIGGITTAVIGTTAAVYALGYAGAFFEGGCFKVGKVLAWLNLKLVAYRIKLLADAAASETAAGATDTLAASEVAEAAAAKGADAAMVTRIGLLGNLKGVLLNIGGILAGSPLLSTLLVGGLGAATGGAIAYRQMKEFQAATDERGKRWNGTHIDLGRKPGEVLYANVKNLNDQKESIFQQVESGSLSQDEGTTKIQEINEQIKALKEAKSPGVIEINLPKMGKGGRVTRPTVALIGEAGTEDVVPLGRGMAASSYTFNATIHVHGTTDPRAVALQVRSELEHAVRDAEARRRGAMHG